MSYISSSSTAFDPAGPDAARTLFDTIDARFNPVWSARGWTLVHDGDRYAISGDEGQFYLDAVANDVHAPLAMAFLARFEPDTYESFRQEALADVIDLDESQDIFLRGKSLEEVLRHAISRPSSGR